MDYLKIKNEIKSPLRYPGGKSKALRQILPMIPEFKEFREPLVGGGSVFIAIKQRVNNSVIFRINDLNSDLYCFWKSVKDDLENLIKQINNIKKEYPNGKELYNKIFDLQSNNEFDKAVRFFIMNRITFSGLADSGGYSQQAFDRRFTQSSIDRIDLLKPIVKNVNITSDDYEKLLFLEGTDVFIFLDPPYWKATKKRLYGKNGDLHLRFDHERFAENMKKCTYKWLITYDDCPKVRELFSFANIYEWKLQYGMNNFKQEHAKIGNELFISNYVPSPNDRSKIDEKKETIKIKTLDKFL